MIPSLSRLAVPTGTDRKSTKRWRFVYDEDGRNEYKNAFLDIATYALSVPHATLYSADNQRMKLQLAVLPMDVVIPRDLVPPLPPPPSRDGDDRYFYLLHRPYDSSSPYPKGVDRIVKTGGVGANILRTSEPWITFDNKNFEPYKDVGSLFGDLMEVGNSAQKMTREYFNIEFQGGDGTLLSQRRATELHDFDALNHLKKFFNWFYLSDYALSHASDKWEDELMFRVPEAWLYEYGDRCLANKWNNIFVTRAVVPLVYRVYARWPEQDAARAMSNTDVAPLTLTVGRGGR